MLSYALGYAMTNPLASTIILTNTIGLGTTLYSISVITFYSLKYGSKAIILILSNKYQEKSN